MYYYIDSYKSGLNKDIVLVDSDTLYRRTVSSKEFLQMCYNNDICSNFNGALKLELNEIDMIKNNATIAFDKFYSVFDILAMDNILMFLYSTHYNSWRVNRLSHISDRVIISGDGRSTFVWYNGFYYEITGIECIRGIYFDESDGMSLTLQFDACGCKLKKKFNGKLWNTVEGLNMSIEKCDRKDAKRKILLKQ